jgi:hypothetical protein
MAVMPPPITTTRRPTGSAPRSAPGAARRCSRRRPRRRPPLLGAEAERVDAGEADGRGRRRRRRGEVGQRDVAAERLAGLDRDAADRQDEIDLGLGEIVRRLVGGDAVFVEPADLRLRVEDDDVVAVHGKAMGAGEPGRPAPTTATRLPVGAARAKGCVPGPSSRRWRSAAVRRSGPACLPPSRARRPPRTASRSGRRGRTCRRGCSRRIVSAAPFGLPVRSRG